MLVPTFYCSRTVLTEPISKAAEWQCADHHEDADASEDLGVVAESAYKGSMVATAEGEVEQRSLFSSHEHFCW